MSLPSQFTDPILRIGLTLAQYPILGDRIREMMRSELFTRGIMTSEELETLARKQAIESQMREGLRDPFGSEDAAVWETRLHRVLDHLTDFYFATNLPYGIFEDLIRTTLSQRKLEDELPIAFNPELAPKYMLFEQAKVIERKPPEERAKYAPLLEEIKVVLIRAMISDQLNYVRIAKNWFTIDDMRGLIKRKIGYGKVGGKAAGMLLASAILRSVGEEDITAHIRIPDSYFLGADLMYTFMRMNGLMHWNDQKYKTAEEVRADYPTLEKEYLAGKFPEDIIKRIKELILETKGKPLIVRSSSQLEDNFGFSFAGKYDSIFCPNQGTVKENLDALINAVIRVYISVVNPDALMYRSSRGLADYDERMAILIQVVEGEIVSDKYYFPHAAGVAFSRNLFRWDPKIKRDDGFLRLVWGLGTRAVDRVGNDYPRLVALSHPDLRPESSDQIIQRYSQRYIDLIDLEKNELVTLPVTEVLNSRYPPIRYLAQVYQENYLAPIRTSLMANNPNNLVLTFKRLLTRTAFSDRMRRMLQLLEKHYHAPVDMEFTAEIQNPNTTDEEICISILQCRPQSYLQDIEVKLPKHLNDDQILFSTSRMVPQGIISDIRYIICVKPYEYFKLSTAAERVNLGLIVGKLNNALSGETFICIGPGRWGTSNPELGVKVGFADVYNARALVEVTGTGLGNAPEPSFGTHFFQDLMESNTFPLAIFLEDENVIFNRDYFNNAPNQIERFIPADILYRDPYIAKTLTLIDVRISNPGQKLELIMDNDKNKAVAFFIPKRGKDE